ncbi:MAG: hypothetical protein R3C02_21365 [Planctomycetaceae bacterium]
MNERVRQILDDITSLEEQLRAALHEQESHLLYEIKGKTIEFKEEFKETHRRLRMGLLRWFWRSELRNVISAPFIYAMLVPFAFLDLSLSVYQLVCFPLYQIPRVKRSAYIIIDRHHLEYLNVIEKLNCVFCGYVNGLLGYGREIASRTEQYWCPIKHARKLLGMHCRYTNFLDYGAAEEYQAELQRLRSSITTEEEPVV